MVAPELRRFYENNGFVVARSLFDKDEVASYREHYMALRVAGNYPGDMAGVNPGSDDPLKKYPRMIHMHRWDTLSMEWMLDERLDRCMTSLLGRSPIAVQTMLYFKPAGARGQALHQDNFFLRVQPGTCMAAWLALDRCDIENGCLQVVPGSHLWPILCPTQADTTQSFTDVAVSLPEGTEVQPIVMEPGDVLFFNGSLVHGSYPNTSADRFRRALIGHYIEGDSELVARFYDPAYRMDGTKVELGHDVEGGPCGVWVEEDGRPVIEMSGQLGKAGASE